MWGHLTKNGKVPICRLNGKCLFVGFNGKLSCLLCSQVMKEHNIRRNYETDANHKDK
jgi:hypothetical protein